MKIIKSKNNKKIFIIAASLLLVGGACLAASYYYKVGPFTPSAKSSTDLNKPTDQQKQSGDDIKKQSVDQATGKNNSATGSDPSPAPKPVDGSTKQSVEADITASSQDTSSLHIRAMIQTVTNSGMCSLAMSGPQQRTYSASVGVQALPSSTTCKGFDIPVDQLAPGLWTATIDFSNETTIASTSKQITVQ